MRRTLTYTKHAAMGPIGLLIISPCITVLSGAHNTNGARKCAFSPWLRYRRHNNIVIYKSLAAVGSLNYLIPGSRRSRPIRARASSWRSPRRNVKWSATVVLTIQCSHYYIVLFYINARTIYESHRACALLFFFFF